MNSLKDDIRREAKRQRSAIIPKNGEADACADLFFKHITLKPNHIIAGYWPMSREFDCTPILERLLQEGYKCALPVMQEGSLILKFALWRDQEPLEHQKIGVMQPRIDKNTKWLEPDIFIVPLLAFDRRGYRLGQGGGYYDATLQDARARKDIIAVGVAYAQQAVLFNLPVEAHDQKLDWVITPQAAHSY